jgi:hypothetical protein
MLISLTCKRTLGHVQRPLDDICIQPWLKGLEQSLDQPQVQRLRPRPQRHSLQVCNWPHSGR